MAKENNNKAEIVVFCHGGCGRWISLKKSSVLPGDYYGCEKNKFGFECSNKFLPLIPGKVRIETRFRGNGFYRIRDVWPNKAMTENYWGSYDNWAGKVAEIVIDKSMKTARGIKLMETIRDGLVFYEPCPDWLSGQRGSGGLLS